MKQFTFFLRITFCLVIFGMTTFHSSLAPAQKHLSDEALFYKISKRLRGVAPNSKELKEFKSMQGKNDAMDHFTSRWLHSREFQTRMLRQIDELFRFRGKFENYNYLFSTSNARPSQVSTFIFLRTLSENRSWDHLLLTSSYEGEFDYNRGDEDTLNFFSHLQPEALPNPKSMWLLSLQETLRLEKENSSSTGQQSPTTRAIHFSEDDQRVGGIITTKKFLSRYTNTNLNQGRRRAAAIFDIFLCDPMIPAIPETPIEGDDFSIVFPELNENKSSEELIKKHARLEDAHGAKKDCMSCHFKLDPVGQIFAKSGSELSPNPSPGKLVFSRGNKVVDIPLRGFRDLTLAIVKQPEYEQCQVRHFWNWFIGVDVPLSQNRLQELVQAFNSRNRRVLDFIHYLVRTPEFAYQRLPLTQDQFLAREVSRIFKNCNSCHAQQSDRADLKSWDLTDFPLGGEHPSGRLYALGQLKWVLDIKGDGSKALMPPRDSLWKLNEQDRATIKKWFDRGAPDYDGKKQDE